MEINIVLVSKELELNEFDCGIPEMNIYLSRYAVRNTKKRIGNTFVAISGENPQKPLGYYTVSMGQILFEELPESMSKGLPRYPIPSFRIEKLAVDSSMQGKGLGELLLENALKKALQVSSDVAVYCILVDALNQKAKDFYLKYSFLPLNNSDLTLYLPLDTLKQC